MWRDGPANRSTPLWAATLSVLTAALLCTYIAFANLGTPSVYLGDECVHVHAAQSLNRGAPFYLPTVQGRAYAGKPPFKIALTALTTRILGESNFSFRLLDALAGLGTAWLIYLFAWRQWRSHLAGLTALLALFGCQAYIFGHGIRHGVQDSMLVFLTTAALFLFFEIFNSSRHSAGGAPLRLPGALWGILVGLAVLTKSAAGLIAPIIAALFIILRRKPFSCLWSLRAALLWGGATFLALGLSYYLALAATAPKVLAYMLRHQIFDRVSTDFGHPASKLFYLERLFIDNAAFPPLLLAGALLLNVFMAGREQDNRRYFLLLWGTAPLIIYSMAGTKYTWYIAPAFPALALLCGLLFRDLARLLHCWQSRHLMAATAAVFVGAAFLVGQNLAAVLKEVRSPRSPLPFEKLAGAVRDYAKRSPADGKLVFLQGPHDQLTLNEQVYATMIADLIKTVPKAKQAGRLLAKERAAFLLANSRQAYSFMEWQQPHGYLLLPAYYNRSRWFMALAFNQEAAAAPFKLFVVDLPPGPKEELTLEPNGIPALLWRPQLRGDAVLVRMGGVLEIAIACQDAKQEAVPSVSLNGLEPTGSWEAAGALWQRRLPLGPGTLRLGANSLEIQVRDCPEAALARLRFTVDLSPENLARVNQELKVPRRKKGYTIAPRSELWPQSHLLLRLGGL